MTGSSHEFLCEDCREFDPQYDRVASVFRFEGDARRMILDFKFNDHFWMRSDFVDWLEAATRVRFKIEQVDIVFPMPTTFMHRFGRGYNQCAYLATGLAKRLGCGYSSLVLRRSGNPKRQVGLSEKERRQNVIGTFTVRKWLAERYLVGKTVMVVDDIMTTGSTLSECSRILKLHGANKVWCVTMARSLRT